MRPTVLGIRPSDALGGGVVEDDDEGMGVGLTAGGIEVGASEGLALATGGGAGSPGGIAPLPEVAPPPPPQAASSKDSASAASILSCRTK